MLVISQTHPLWSVYCSLFANPVCFLEWNPIEILSRQRKKKKCIKVVDSLNTPKYSILITLGCFVSTNIIVQSLAVLGMGMHFFSSSGAETVAWRWNFISKIFKSMLLLSRQKSFLFSSIQRGNLQIPLWHFVWAACRFVYLQLYCQQ